MDAASALIDRRIPDDFGYACAEAMGESAYCPLPPGHDGKAFFLESGLVMKVTTSRVEAALCQALAHAAKVPGLFEVRDVRRVALDDGEEAFVVLREELSEVFEDPGPEDAYAVMRWREAVHGFDGGWQLKDDAILARAVEAAPPEARLGPALEGLRWLKDRYGADGRDLHLDNFGRSASGVVCIRDVSRFRMKEEDVTSTLSSVEPLRPAAALGVG